MLFFRAHRFACGISRVATFRMMRIALPVLHILIAASPTVAEDKAVTEEKPAASQEAPVDETVQAAKKEFVIRMIGATALVTEMSTGVPLPARVDTGATCCSIHCGALEIKDADPDPKVNIGKPVRFLIEPRDGKSKGEWIEAKIVDHVTIRTSESEDERYKVRLKLRVDDIEKKVLVTLNDRENMKYPLLLGRNFLRDDFLVNVSMKGEK
jgi:hypothetical protein